MTYKEQLLAIYDQAPKGNLPTRKVSSELTIYIDETDYINETDANKMFIVYDYRNIKVRLSEEEGELTPYMQSVLNHYKSDYQRGYEAGIKVASNG